MNIQPEWLSGLIGVIAPLIVRWITGANLSRKTKSIFAILVSTVIGFASSFLSGQFDPGTVLKSIAICFSISQVVYDQVFKDIFSKREEQDIPFVQ
jgi:MFS-type transporter involved in bile tolerance (Atg22 family)